ncbi:MAG: hypothetical protein KGL39_48305 [Patescibacteria group bacterium]|nr:hypothetical protein [Patescibacteria group bacterium]
MASHPRAIVDTAAERFALGETATVRGSALVFEGTRGALSINCGDANSAQGLLDLATAAAAGPEYDPLRAKLAAETATLAAANKATLIHERNRWLAESDTYVLPPAALPPDLPADVVAVLTAGGTPSPQDQLKAWRQALRDWPSTVADWTNPGPLPSPPSLTLASGRPLLILT